jgi:hypothetical protein
MAAECLVLTLGSQEKFINIENIYRTQRRFTQQVKIENK